MGRGSAVRAGVALLLVLALTAGVYLASGPRTFVFDDDRVIMHNEHLRLGLSRAGLAWAFGEFSLSNWYPMTWVSHLAAYHVFELEPAGHQRVNLALHLANTALLALALVRLTGAAGPSVFVAALFALHPLHVETVAWVTERCGLLSGFFGLLALVAYVGYARRPGPLRALGVTLAFAAGLLSKAALVTLPVVFLLLDFWPLGRWQGSARRSAGRPSARLRAVVGLAVEKLHLLALAGVAIVVTFFAQQQGGAVVTLSALPFGTRLANAAVTYVDYLGKTFWPQGLAVYYALPLQPWPVWQVGLCALALLAVTALCLRRLRPAPFLAVGWLWYLVGLLPVIGFVKTGEQVMADRYTYLPLTGIFVAFAWGAQRLARRLRGRRALLVGVSAVVLLALAVATRAQVRFWKDEGTLFARALDVAPDSWLVHANLGKVLLERGQVAEALGHLRQAANLNPQSSQVHLSLGAASLMLGNPAEAAAAFSRALQLRPNSAATRNNLGLAFVKLGRRHEAIEQFREARRLNPTYVEIHLNLGDAYAGEGAYGTAADSYREALRLNPDEVRARTGLARLGLAGTPGVSAAH